MKIIELNADNVSAYDSILDEDISESIGREFYRGIVAVENESSPSGALIWEYKNLEEDKKTKAEICYINSESADVIKALLAKFDEQASSLDVKQSFFETARLSNDISDCFIDDGFDISAGESQDIVISVSDLKPLTTLRKKISNKIMGLSEIQELQFMQGVTNCLFHGKKGIVEDLEYIDKDWFDEIISCSVITDGKVSGMFLIHRFPSGILMPVLFTAMGPESKLDLLNMIVFSARKAVENYSSDTRIILRRHNASVDALTKKLFAGKSGEEVVRGNREYKARL